MERRGKANAGGFFWRFKGQTHGPWSDPKPTNLNPVEQLGFETGDLLKSYKSYIDARRAMGMTGGSKEIRDVCNGDRATVQGYFWRWKGSKALPNHLLGVQKSFRYGRPKEALLSENFVRLERLKNTLVTKTARVHSVGNVEKKVSTWDISGTTKC